MRKARKMGYRDGYRQGYRLGLCEVVRAQNPPAQGTRRPLKLMYVPQGFDAIDAGVSEALAGLVTELIIAPANDMLETAVRESPQAVLVMNGLHVFPENHLEQVAGIRSMGIPVAVWFVDDPYFTADTAELCRHYDHVFTHELGCVEFYRSVGAQSVHYLPLCVNPAMFHPRKIGPEYRYDIVFIGNAFYNRTELFDKLAPLLCSHRTFIAGGFWERLQTYDRLSPLIHGGFIPPEETANYYTGAKLVINIHRPWEPGSDNRNAFGIPARSINPRTYEISACGTMQLTDIRDDLKDHYQPGYDLETFESANELESKIEYYLKHPMERQKFALRSLRTTLTRHTFMARLPELLDTIHEARACEETLT